MNESGNSSDGGKRLLFTDDKNNNQIEEERQSKRLRSGGEPDLKVVVGSGNSTATKWYHSQTLATKSKYIDVMLSTAMKESSTNTITFPDIGVETWDKMMLFLDSPVSVRRMSELDVVEVAVFYEKYGFAEGTKLCDDLLADYYESSLETMEKTLSLDLNFLIDSLGVAKDANLSAALVKGVRYVWKKMHSEDASFGRTMFRECHMKKLSPVLLHAFAPENIDKMGGPVSVTRRGVAVDFPCTNTVQVGWKGSGNILPRSFDVGDPAFAKSYVTACTERAEELLLHNCIQYIVISGVNVMFKKDSVGSATSPECYVYRSTEKATLGESSKSWYFVCTKLRKKKWQDWRIIATGDPHYPFRGNQFGSPPSLDVDEKICWVAPNTINLNFPPKSGWKAVDPLAKGTPTINYILNDRI